MISYLHDGDKTEMLPLLVFSGDKPRLLKYFFAEELEMFVPKILLVLSISTFILLCFGNSLALEAEIIELTSPPTVSVNSEVALFRAIS